MSFGRRPDKPPPAPEPTGVEPEQFANSQEAVPLPWLAGSRKIAVRWISRVYNQRAQAAPLEKPSKK